MEKLIYTEQEKTYSKIRLLQELILAVFVSFGFCRCAGTMFGLEWSLGTMFSGRPGKGLVTVWNQIADVLGNSDYILLTKLENQSENGGLFLSICFLGTAVLAFFLIRSCKIWTLLIFTTPAVINVICHVQIPATEMILLAAALLVSVAWMKMKNGFWMILVLGMVLMFACIFIIRLPGVSDFADKPAFVKSVQNTFSDFVQSKWQGENSLGNGDLTKRERQVQEDTALEIKMSNPQSVYLRGFTGDMYTADGWDQLPASSYYNANTLMYWLKQDGFNGTGQIGQAASFTEKAGEENEIHVTVKNADKKYAYIPYEIEENGMKDSRNWGNEFITAERFKRMKSYSYTARDNAVKDWTAIAAEIFTTAQTGEKNKVRDIQDYLLNESYYNEFVYNNYTYLSQNERELIYEQFGSSGDQTKGHIDYKKAITDIRTYLNENFIYTEHLGTAEENKGALEEFLSSKKGYDVQYATAAVLLFRYYGIPARYVEGYLVTPKDTEGKEPYETIEISGDRIHAWAEIYIDGVGFVPIEVCPEYEGIMEEADMEIGISNNSLLRTFERETGKGYTSDTEIISGGDDKQLPSIQYWVAAAVVICIILAILLILIGKILCRKISEFLKREKLFKKAAPKTAVSAVFGYMEQMNYPVCSEMKELGNRAAYSPGQISEEERKRALAIYKAAKKEKRIYEKSWTKKGKEQL